MGILKNLTDEYFGENARTEDGKYITVHGCKVLVPVDYNEEKFLSYVDELLDTEYYDSYPAALIVSSSYIREYDDKIKVDCDGTYLVLYNFSDIDSEYIPEGTDKKLYDSFIKFMKHIADGVSLMIHRSTGHICLVDESTMYNDFDMLFYEAGVDGDESYWCFKNLVGMFIEEFGDKVDIDEDDLVFMSYNNYASNILLPVESSDDIIKLKRFMYAKEMTEWWKKELKSINDQGVLDYFGINPPEDEPEDE